MASETVKKRRKRNRIAIELSEEELADFDRKCNGRSKAEFAKERIFLSENFRDPMFEMSAKLSAHGAPLKRLKELLERCDADNRDVAALAAAAACDRQLAEEFKHAVKLVEQIAEDAKEARRMIADRATSARASAKIRSGIPRSC
jgi:hypothetical protein